MKAKTWRFKKADVTVGIDTTEWGLPLMLMRDRDCGLINVYFFCFFIAIDTGEAPFGDEPYQGVAGD